MNDLTFSNSHFGTVRVIVKDGEPWFVASDVAKCLGYERPADAVNLHCKKSIKSTNTVNHRDGEAPVPPTNINIIPESDVYRLVMRSNLPNAEKFQDWVCDDVLPSIRRNGSYSTSSAPQLPDFTNPAEAARAWASEYEQKTQALEQIEQNKPKVLFADAVSCSKNSILVGELAKLISQNGINIGQNRLFNWMRDNGYLTKRYNAPTQYAMDRGLFERVERVINNPDGSIRNTFTTKVTGKGQIYFCNIFLKEAQCQRRGQNDNKKIPEVL